jgi:hypothetical protein
MAQEKNHLKMVVVVQYGGDEPEADASPIDHVLEEQACEMLRIFKSVACAGD